MSIIIASSFCGGKLRRENAKNMPLRQRLTLKDPHDAKPDPNRLSRQEFYKKIRVCP